jgi:hypothetical protein
MTKVNFSAARKKAEEAGLLGGGNVWKPKEGANPIRLVSECLEHPGEFKGPDGKVKKTFKWLCFILDRVDGEVKAYFMPNAVYEQIEDYQLTPGWEFDEVPMPYDVTLRVRNAGTLKVEYKVIADPARKPLTAEETQKIAEAGSIRAYQNSIYESQGAAGTEEKTIVMDEASNVPLPPEPPVQARHSTVPPQFRPQVPGTGSIPGYPA